MDTKTIAKRSLADFPEALVPEGEWDVLYKLEDPSFGLGGIDGEGRLIHFGDDGWIIGYDLRNASVERTRFGKRIDAPQETVAELQMPEEFMMDRDVSDWRWVNPRYEYLTDGSPKRANREAET